MSKTIALAAALFAGRSDVLARMLAIPVPQVVAVTQDAALAADDGCPHESAAAAGDEVSPHAHHDAGAGSHEKTEHAAHGIVCSFCLTASAGLTLPAAVPAAACALPAVLPLSSQQQRELDTPQFPGHRSRAPPSL